MNGLVLYVKPGCHLCDEAREVIKEASPSVAVAEQDITREPDLMSRFGVRIPVLARTDTGATLDWPFGPQDVLDFLAPGPKSGA